MQADQARIVFTILDRLSSARTTQGVVDTLGSAVRDLTSADGITVMLRDGGYVQCVGDDPVDPLWDGQRIPLDSCLGGWVILNRQSAFVEDVDTDSRVSRITLANRAVRSYAVFPIRSGEPLGALGVYWTERLQVDQHLVSTLQTLANACAMAIENARLFGWVEVAYRSARQEAQKYANLVNTVNGVVWEGDLSTFRFTFVSEQAARLLGYPLSDWTSDRSFWLNHVHADDRDWAGEFRLRPSEPGRSRHFEYRMIAVDGGIVWVADDMSVGRRADNTGCLHGMMVDITEQKGLERQIAWHALYDSLTSLPNRSSFLDQAENEVRRADLSPMAMLSVDIDRFQHVNDSFGHLAGDALLMAVASRLRTSSCGLETVARLSGDEFAILAPGAGYADKARALADRIHALLSRPFNIAGSPVYLTASIGIALGTEARRPARDLLREADTAMYHAKHSGRARSEFFHASMHRHALSRLQLESDLRSAVTKHEMDLHYQPIVDLNNHEILGFEALLRWSHPTRGVLLPAEFLTAADDIGLMTELGYQTISRACNTLGRWSRKKSRQPWISVNLSPMQLNNPDLAEAIRQAIHTNSIRPENLKLEITEAGMVQTEAAVQGRLRELHEIGVGIFIDDFGTGMSSFGRLLDAPVDTIKIDRRFVEQLSTPGSPATLLRSIVNLGKNLNIGLIAEGVETGEQVEGLRQLGCDVAQGFYFARPAPVDLAEALIAQ